MVWLGPTNKTELAVWRKEQTELLVAAQEAKGRIIQTVGVQTGVSGSTLLAFNAFYAHMAWGPTAFIAVAMLLVSIVMIGLADQIRNPNSSDIADAVGEHENWARKLDEAYEKAKASDMRHITVHYDTQRHHEQELAQETDLRAYVRKMEEYADRVSYLEKKLAEQQARPEPTKKDRECAEADVRRALQESLRAQARASWVIPTINLDKKGETDWAAIKEALGMVKPEDEMAAIRERIRKPLPRRGERRGYRVSCSTCSTTGLVQGQLCFRCSGQGGTGWTD